MDDPAAAFEGLVALFRPATTASVFGVSERAVVDPSAHIGARVTIHPLASIGAHAEIGDDVEILPGAVIGAWVRIGHGSTIHPSVTVRERSVLGARVVVHANSVIGADGFGYRQGSGGHEKIEHIGTVEIGDDVEIGANCTIDRARFGRTCIGSGTKIDNQVHIAHNVQIGRHCVVIAQTGISGSAVIGDGCMIGGQSGIVGHVRVGPGSMLAARSGISKDVPAGSVMYGFIAADHRVRKREEAAVRRLPEMARRVRAMEAEIASLKSRLQGGGS